MALSLKSLLNLLLTQMKTPLTLLTTTLLLTACSIFPQSESDLAASGRKSGPICVDVGRDTVIDRMRQHLATAYRTRTVTTATFGDVKTNDAVLEQKTNELTTFNVVKPSGLSAGYFVTIKIADGGPTCKTLINAYAFNFSWANEFDNLKPVAEGKYVEK